MTKLEKLKTQADVAWSRYQYCTKVRQEAELEEEKAGDYWRMMCNQQREVDYDG
tara:strand:- start:1624 stop:1785 length:162 start_codon:yes stop_codon:yes gene_type:complete